MTFSFGARSRANLEGVHPDLVRVAARAIEITEQDFMILDGVRTLAEQEDYVRRGVSKTMKSQHLPHDDGLGHAIDAVPFINGQPRWEWKPSCAVAEAFRTAANELGVMVRWGGSWSRINGTTGTMEQLSREYARNHPGPDFIDAVHFELLRL